MTIANEITRINNAKAAIKEAIQNKGVTVSDTAKLDEYPAFINSISTSSGEGGDSNLYPNFFEIRTNGNTDYSFLFYNSKVTDADFSNIDTSKVANMERMFYYCSLLSSLNLSNVNTSNVTNMASMFQGCSKLTSLDLSSFNTSKVTDMSYIFSGCKELATLDLSSFDMRSITTATNMFNNCSKLITLDLSGVNTSKINNISYMFCKCTLLKDIIGELDLSGLTGGFYPGSSTQPFYGCTSLETLYLKNIYKNCTMTNASKFSINLNETKIKDECLIYIINELPDLINDKGLTATDKIILTLPPTNTLTAEQVQVALDKGWTCANIATASATYGLRRRMFYKAVECEEGAYQASDGSRYEIFEANNVVTPDGVAEWDVFSSIEDASLTYGLTYIGEQEDGQ